MSSTFIRRVVILALAVVPAIVLSVAAFAPTTAVANHRYTQFGYDVAEWNPVINGAKAKREGYDFAMRRVSTGLKEDRSNKANLAQFKRGGLVPGGYHYVVHGVSPAEQADFFLSKLGDSTGQIIEVDAETYDHNGYEGAPTCLDMKGFIERLRERLGARRHIFVYSGAWFYNDPKYGFTDCQLADSYTHLWDGSNFVEERGVKKNQYGYDIYQHTRPSDWKARYGGWETVTILQFSLYAQVTGVKNIDVDAFRGTLDELKRYTR